MITLPAGKAPGSEFLKVFAALEKKAIADLRAEGFSGARLRLERSLAVRYRGQSFELEIPWEKELTAAFHRTHRERYGHGDVENDLEIVNVRLRATGLTSKPRIGRHRKRRSRAVPKGETRLWLSNRSVLAPVYERASLEPGALLRGPAIIVEYGSTTLVPAGWSAEVDTLRNLVLEPRGEAS
jgi:N-methylhydantoinase A